MAYIQMHTPKARNAKQKAERQSLYGRFEETLTCNKVWKTWSLEEKIKLQAQARQCAQIFQRSSSCVEGRNGQLALQHHASRKLKPRKMAASTVIHNYFVKRPNGTTAAERLFEQEPDNLFEWLLARTDSPHLPAKKRPQKIKLPMVA